MGCDVFYDGALKLSPPLSEEDAALVSSVVKLEKTEKTEPVFATFLSQPGRDIPYFGGLLKLSPDREYLLPEEDDSRHGLSLWLDLLIQCVFLPRGYLLSGEVSWAGEDRDDAGTVFVKNNVLECVDDLIVNAGPSWAPKHHCDKHSQEALQELVASADSTGCTPDLSVVASAPLERLRSILTEV